MMFCGVQNVHSMSKKFDNIDEITSSLQEILTEKDHAEGKSAIEPLRPIDATSNEGTR